MNVKIIFSFIFITSLSSSIWADSETFIPPGTVIYIGDDEVDGNWPPFEYFIPTSPGLRPEPAGYNIDLLEIIAKEYNIIFEYVTFPWNRIFLELESGENIQMILPTSLNPDRLGKFLISRSIYQITPSYFYLNNRFPNGIDIESPEEIFDYGDVNGRVGYNYTNFGVHNEDVNRIAKSGKNLFDQLRIGRCDFVLARYETTAGMYLIGENLLDTDIDYNPMPGVQKEDFHFLISRTFKYGDELIRIIDRTVENMEKTGELKELLDKYLNIPQ